MHYSILARTVAKSIGRDFAGMVFRVFKTLTITALVAIGAGTGCATTDFLTEDPKKSDFVTFNRVGLYLDPQMIRPVEPTFSQTTQRAAISEEPQEKLLSQGYAVIGTVAGRHFARQCDGSGACKTFMEQADHLSALLDKAAQGGGEKVIWTELKQEPHSKPTSSGKCLQRESIGHYEDYYDYGQKRMRRRYVVPCRVYDTKGWQTDWSLSSRGLVFRHEPKLAETMLRYEHLRKAAKEGNLTVVKEIIQKGQDPNWSYGPLWPPLLSAIEGHQLKVAEYLLDHGVNLKKYAYLASAVVTEDVDITKLLIKRGADVNFDYRPRGDVRFFMHTPLHSAAKVLGGRFKGSPDIVRTLLASGADVNAGDRCGWTPLDAAKSSLSSTLRPKGEELAKQKEIIRILEEAGGVATGSKWMPEYTKLCPDRHGLVYDQYGRSPR